LDININLPRPRFPEIRLESKFKDIYDSVWQILRKEALKSKFSKTIR